MMVINKCNVFYQSSLKMKARKWMKDKFFLKKKMARDANKRQNFQGEGVGKKISHRTSFRDEHDLDKTNAEITHVQLSLRMHPLRSRLSQASHEHQHVPPSTRRRIRCWRGSNWRVPRVWTRARFPSRRILESLSRGWYYGPNPSRSHHGSNPAKTPED